MFQVLDRYIYIYIYRSRERGETEGSEREIKRKRDFRVEDETILQIIHSFLTSTKLGDYTQRR